MPDYTLSRKAASDFDDIYVYSYQTFGETKADTYCATLCDRLQDLANAPQLGHAADHILQDLFCARSKRHLIFYTIETDGIFVARILHDAMDALQHFSF